MLNKYFDMFVNYVFNNELIIDKGTYLTVVIGQITVYAILLTFYQFIVSFQGTSERTIQRYLGCNLIEYYIGKELVIYNRIISKPIFGFLFVLEILYKPIINLYGNLIPEKVMRFLNFAWYTYVVVFFVLFVLLFFQCTRCVLSLKAVIDKRRNASIIRNINRDFRKKRFIDYYRHNSIDLLWDDMQCLEYTIAEDNGPKLQMQYTELIIDILNDYKKEKEREIEQLVLKNYKSKNQIAWKYNMDCEARLLRALASEKYVQKSRMLDQYISNLQFELLELNLRRASVDNYEKICIDCLGACNDAVDCREWETLTKELFNGLILHDKKKFVEGIYRGCHCNNILYGYYCQSVLREIIRESLWNVFEEKMKQEDFVNIFECVMVEDAYNDFFAKLLGDSLTAYNKKSMIEMVKLLNKTNQTYVFVYVFLYYSIYRFRFEWEYMNIDVLKELIKGITNEEGQFQKVNNMILNSRIGHRYSPKKYTLLTRNLESQITGKWLDEIYQQDGVDPFYLTMLKLCVLGQEYQAFYEEGTIESKIFLINELMKHEELLSYENVKRMYGRMQYIDFRELEKFPKKLHITLRSLLLTDMKISDELIDDEIEYCYYISVGQYLLVKHREEKKSKIKRDLIRKAYVASNMPIDEYVEFLHRECAICNVQINYAQKEKMKNYLAKIL